VLQDCHLGLTTILDKLWTLPHVGTFKMHVICLESKCFFHLMMWEICSRFISNFAISEQ
jgi:hypothetical protein